MRLFVEPLGLLLISTPDTGHFLSFLMRSPWQMPHPMQHLFLFSRQALVSALRAEGFRVIILDIAYKTHRVDYLIKQSSPLNPPSSATLAPWLCQRITDLI